MTFFLRSKSNNNILLHYYLSKMCSRFSGGQFLAAIAENSRTHLLRQDDTAKTRVFSVLPLRTGVCVQKSVIREEIPSFFSFSKMYCTCERSRECYSKSEGCRTVWRSQIFTRKHADSNFLCADGRRVWRDEDSPVEHPRPETNLNDGYKNSDSCLPGI